MTVKQRAILQTVGILAVIFTASVAVSVILATLTAEQITMGFGALSIAVLIWAMYGVILSRLQYEETLKTLVDKR